jgi:hypothetical protein
VIPIGQELSVYRSESIKYEDGEWTIREVKMATSRKVIVIFSIAAIGALALTSGVASAGVITVPDDYTAIHDVWANAQVAHAPTGPWSFTGTMVAPFSDRWKANFQNSDFDPSGIGTVPVLNGDIKPNLRDMLNARTNSLSDTLGLKQSQISWPSRAPVGSSGESYNVPGDYPTIQDAIDNATGGETILVEPSRYNETVDVTVSNIVIKANSTNPADTIVSANGTDDHVVNITNQTNVTLEGFTIQDARGASKDAVGIYMNTTSDCTITNTVIMNISTAGSYDAYGVLVEIAINLTSTDTTVREIHGNNNSIGILIEEGMNVDFDPTLIENVTASNGTAFGLLIDAINLSFTDTTIRDITGNSSAYGILMNAENVSFNPTVIERVNAPNGQAYGISAYDIYAYNLQNGSFTDTTIRDITGNSSAYGIYMNAENVSFSNTTIHNITGNIADYDTIGVFIGYMINGSFTDTTISDIDGNDFAIGIFGYFGFINVSFSDTTIRDININGNGSAAGFVILPGLETVNVTFDYTIIERVSAHSAQAVCFLSEGRITDGSFTDTTIRDITGNSLACGNYMYVENVSFDLTVIERVNASNGEAGGIVGVIQNSSFTDTTIRDIAGNSSTPGYLVKCHVAAIAGGAINTNFSGGEITNCGNGVWLELGEDNRIEGFIIRDNTLMDTGVHLGTNTSNTTVWLYCFYDNGLEHQAWDDGMNNDWDSNFWSDYPLWGVYDIAGVAGSKDHHTLRECGGLPNIFDTDSSANPYPSISGTHNGTITPSYNISVSKLYTYPCPGTGGHTEYIEISNKSGIIATGRWEGYSGDWHNISFYAPFVLDAGEVYNYTIKTGSYPQIHHNRTLQTENGWINCTEFTDVNGKRYDNWIPAIKLF